MRIDSHYIDKGIGSDTILKMKRGIMVKIDVRVGDKVRLEPKNLFPLQDAYEVVKIDAKRCTVRDNKGIILYIHKTRIAEVIREEKNMTTTVKPVPEKVEKKVEKKEVKLAPFDLTRWVQNHGGVHLVKTDCFNHKEYKLDTHVCVNEGLGHYSIINVYTYPNGLVSLGKKNKGESQYPLKGHKATRKIVRKSSGQVAAQHFKGDKTAAEKIAEFEKRGYKKC